MAKPSKSAPPSQPKKKIYLMRLLIIGDTAVGKTSLLLRFNEDRFICDQKTTIGVDYKAKELEIDGVSVKLQVKLNSYIISFLLICILIFIIYSLRFGILLAKRDFVQ